MLTCLYIFNHRYFPLNNYIIFKELESNLSNSQKAFSKLVQKNDDIINEYLKQGKFVIKTIVGRFFTFDKDFIKKKFKTFGNLKDYLSQRIYHGKINQNDIILFQNQNGDSDEDSQSEFIIDDDTVIENETLNSGEYQLYLNDFKNAVIVKFIGERGQEDFVNVPEFFTTNDLYIFITQNMENRFELKFEGKILENSSSLSLKNIGFISNGKQNIVEVVLKDNE